MERYIHCEMPALAYRRFIARRYYRKPRQIAGQPVRGGDRFHQEGKMRALHLTLMLAMAVICLAPLRAAHGAEISAFRYHYSFDGCGGVRNCFIITIDGPIEPGDHKKLERQFATTISLTRLLIYPAMVVWRLRAWGSAMRLRNWAFPPA